MFSFNFLSAFSSFEFLQKFDEIFTEILQKFLQS